MTLLTIVQDAAEDLGISKPTNVVSNSTPQVRQLLQLAQREARDLASRYLWSGLVRENAFTLTTAADQGVINGTVVSDSDFDHMVNGTFLNRTTNLPIGGPTSEVDWQRLQAFPVTGPYLQYRIQGGRLYIDPTPPADSVAFEYKSTHFCEDSSGTGKARWSDDTDVARLDENLLSLGIIWRWRHRKGLDYAQDFENYESRVAAAMSRDKSKPILDMSAENDSKPGVFVPVGNWNP